MKTANQYTAETLREALRVYDEDNCSNATIRDFGLWWWNTYLNDAQRNRLRNNSRSSWGDLQALPDEELMFLWACFLM